MTRLLFSLISLWYTGKPVYAQTDFIVTLKGDTLFGEVFCVKQGPTQKIEYRAAKKKQYFMRVQVRTFRSKGEDYYPVRTPNGYQVMKLLKAGYLSLYAFQLENQLTWDGLYLQKKDGSGIEFSGLLFKKRMAHFTEDCPEVSRRIEEKELRRQDLNEMIDLYNHCIEQKTVSQSTAMQYARQWQQLEQQVMALAEFEGKTDALEMIKEIRNKLDNHEPIPRFLRESLRTALQPYPDVLALLEELIGRLQN